MPGREATILFTGMLFATGRSHRRATRNVEHAHHNAEEFRSPEIRREMNHQRGPVLSSVDGTSLHFRLKNGGVDQVTALQIGRALRRLHGTPAAPICAYIELLMRQQDYQDEHSMQPRIDQGNPLRYNPIMLLSAPA